MKVQNTPGTAKRSPKCRVCGPWIDHWFNKTDASFFDRAFLRCARCHNSMIVEGGHVVKSSDPNGPEYIVPLCHECNTKDVGVPFEVDCQLVRAVQCTPDSKG